MSKRDNYIEAGKQTLFFADTLSKLEANLKAINISQYVEDADGESHL